MLSAYIREKRDGLGLSQAELGKRVDVSQAFVNKLEHGSPIPLDKVRAWADALKLTDDERPKFYDLCLAAQSQELASAVRDLRRQVDALRIIAAPPSDAAVEEIAKWAVKQPQTVVIKLLVRALAANLRLAAYLPNDTHLEKTITPILRTALATGAWPDALAQLAQLCDEPESKPSGSLPVPRGSRGGRQ